MLGTWLHASIKNVAGLQIPDFIQSKHEISVSEAHPGDEQWHFLSVTRTIRPGATGLPPVGPRTVCKTT